MFPITAERPADAAQIETLLDLTFGSERTRKTVYRLREGVAHLRPLAFVVREQEGGRDSGRLLGSIRYWPVALGEAQVPAIMLGPVEPWPTD